MIGSLWHSCLVNCIEWVLQGESTSLFKGAGVESVELGRLSVVKLHWLKVFNVLSMEVVCR